MFIDFFFCTDDEIREKRIWKIEEMHEAIWVRVCRYMHAINSCFWVFFFSIRFPDGWGLSYQVPEKFRQSCDNQNKVSESQMYSKNIGICVVSPMLIKLHEVVLFICLEQKTVYATKVILCWMNHSEWDPLECTWIVSPLPWPSPSVHCSSSSKWESPPIPGPGAKAWAKRPSFPSKG